MEEFQKITQVRLPFDRRHSDASKNYGIHGLDVWFILRGPKGAVQYAVTFPVYLPNVEKEYVNKFPDWNSRKEILGFDVGYHSETPMYKNQSSMKCEHTKTGICYYDGSSLRADDWTQIIFRTTGEAPENVLWKMLENEYKERFEP